MNKDAKIVSDGAIELLRQEKAKNVRQGATIDLLVDMLISSNNLELELNEVEKLSQGFKKRLDKCDLVEHGMIELSKIMPLDNAYAEKMQFISDREAVEIMNLLHSIAFVALNWGNHSGQGKVNQLEALVKQLEKKMKK